MGYKRRLKLLVTYFDRKKGEGKNGEEHVFEADGDAARDCFATIKEQLHQALPECAGTGNYVLSLYLTDAQNNVLDKPLFIETDADLNTLKELVGKKRQSLIDLAAKSPDANQIGCGP